MHKLFNIKNIAVILLAISILINIKDANAATGTCFVDNSCSSNVDQTTCTSSGGQFLGTGSISSYDKCKLGCCTLNLQAMLSTYSQCKALAANYSLAVSWDPSAIDETSCLNKLNTEDKGCCKTGAALTTACKYTTKGDCNSLSGSFTKDFCSRVNGCEDCKTHNDKICYNNDVYNVDSCGNIEDLYKSCDYPTSKCDDKTKTCKSLDCETTWKSGIVNYDGVARENGESWCEYEAVTGTGLDLPGSIHYRHSCIKGKEIVDSKQDENDPVGRKDICVNVKIKDKDGNPVKDKYGNDFMTAVWQKNEADKCSDCNDEEKYSDKDQQTKCCNDLNPSCFWADRCLPNVPIGKGDDETCGGKEPGDKGTKQYEATFKRHVGEGHWNCEKNCNLYENGDVFIGSNLICGAQGDCGAKYNLLKTFSNSGFSRICDRANELDKDYGTLKKIPQNQPISDVDCGGRERDTTGKGGQQLSFGSFNNYNKAGNGLEIDLPKSALELLFGGGKKLETVGELSDVVANIIWPALGSRGIYGADYLAFLPGVGYMPTIRDVRNYISSRTSVGDFEFNGQKYPINVLDPAFSVGEVVINIFESWTDQIDTTHVKMRCDKWEPPSGGSDCDKCYKKKSEGGLVPDELYNADALSHLCTAYRCKSLGTRCDFKNDICYDTKDLVGPKISPAMDSILSKECKTASCSVDTTSIANGFLIKGDLKENIPITLAVQTDKASNCKYKIKVYDNEIEGDFSPNNDKTMHTATFPDSNFNDLGISLLPDGKQYDVIISCTSLAGVQNVPSNYIARFKITLAPDIVPPQITSFNPKSPAYAAYNQNNKTISFDVLERFDSATETVTCKYDKLDKPFDQMENSVTCRTPCDATLAKLVAGENKFYFRCRDSDGNTNTYPYPSGGYLYTVTRTGALNITDIEPTGSIFSKNVTLTVSTFGGAEQGRAVCEYGKTNSYEAGEMFDTNSSVSTQTLPVSTGAYTYYIKCTDIAGNIAAKTAKFVVKVDTIPPKILSISQDTQYGSKLKIVTSDENKVKCQYDTKDFSFGNGKDMQTVGDVPSMSHYVDYGLGTYYVRCQDSFSNEMSAIIYT